MSCRGGGLRGHLDIVDRSNHLQHFFSTNSYCPSIMFSLLILEVGIEECGRIIEEGFSLQI